MYQYVKQNLINDLAKKESYSSKKEKELKEIQEKLEDIKSYDELLEIQFLNFLITSIATFLGISLGCSGIFILIKVATFSEVIFGGVLSAVSIFCLFYTKLGIQYIMNNINKIRSLKQKGVKKFKKQADILQDKKLALEKEKSDIQCNIEEITATLTHIDFFEKTAHDFLYQADSKEEYEAMLDTKLKCEQLFDQYLDGKRDYSSIQLNDCSNDTVVFQKKLHRGKRK